MIDDPELKALVDVPRVRAILYYQTLFDIRI